MILGYIQDSLVHLELLQDLTAIPNYDYILKSSKVEEGKRTRWTARITKVGQTEKLGHKQMQTIVSIIASSFPRNWSKRLCDKQEAILRTYILSWTNDPNEMLVNAFGKRKDQSRNHLQLSKQCSWEGQRVVPGGLSTLRLLILHVASSFFPNSSVSLPTMIQMKIQVWHQQVHGGRPDFTSSFHSFSFGWFLSLTWNQQHNDWQSEDAFCTLWDLDFQLLRTYRSKARW